MKETKKTINVIINGKKIVCQAVHITRQKIVSFVYLYGNRTVKVITLPTATSSLARKMIQDLDSLFAKEIFKLDIIC